MTGPLILRNHEGLAVEVTESAFERRERLVADAADVKSVSDEFTAEVAVDVVRGIKGCLAEVEEARKAIKAPILEMGRKIDALAKGYSEPLEREAARVNRLISAYNAEQARLRAEEEARRQAELARIERERQERESAGDASAADAAVDAQRAVVAPPLPAPARITGTAIKTVWEFEVTDVHALYAARPHLCRLEPDRSAIRRVLAAGDTEIPGVRAWKQQTTEVRRG